MKLRTTRREFLAETGRAALAGLAAAGPLAAFPPKAHGGEKEVRIGYIPITDASPLLIAHANGYFRDEGLVAPEPIRIRSWSALAESFLAGKFNVTHLLLPIPVWMRFNRKVPVKVMAWDHTGGSALTVRGDSGIKGFADLGGRHIAVPYWYSMHNVILQMGLRSVGLSPVIQPQDAPLKADQVNLFILPPPEMPAALAGRKIDGFIVAEPYNAVGELKTGAKIMRFTGDIWKHHPCCVVVMNEEMTKRDPVFTQKVMNAIVRAQLFCAEQPGEAARILSKDGHGYLPVSREVTERVFLHYDLAEYGPGAVPQAIRHPDWQTGRIGFQPYPYPSATRFIVSEMTRTVMEGDMRFLAALDPAQAARELMDDTFVKQAIMAVGGPGKFREMDLTSPWEREEVIAI